MPLIIPDEVLKELNMGECVARIELACRLFDADKLSKPAASRLAGLKRVDFEEELAKRGLPIIHYTLEMLKQDMEALEKKWASLRLFPYAEPQAFSPAMDSPPPEEITVIRSPSADFSTRRNWL